MAVLPKERTVVASSTTRYGCGPPNLILNRYSAFVIGLPSSMYTRSLSKIRSRARLSLRDSPSNHACSSTTMDGAPLSCAQTERNAAKARIRAKPIVLLSLARWHRLRLQAGETRPAFTLQPALPAPQSRPTVRCCKTMCRRNALAAHKPSRSPLPLSEKRR
jgi:hypothetical protein